MNHPHPEPTETIECEECVMPSTRPENLINNPDGSSTLLCVKCPFCLQTVNAHMTKTSIACPACKVVVEY